jgi:hypothetical protein
MFFAVLEQVAQAVPRLHNSGRDAVNADVALITNDNPLIGVK